MTQQYGAVLTALGEAKITAAIANNAKMQFTHLAVGDGAGKLPELHQEQTALLHENYRVALNSLTIDPDNSSHLIAEAILREEIGGWWIREMGLFDEQGELCAVANCPETYKPKLEEGAGRTQVIRLVLIVSSATAVALTLDPAVALATRRYVDDQIDTIKNYLTTLGLGTVLSNTNTFEGEMEQDLAPGEYYVNSEQLHHDYFYGSNDYGGILKVFKLQDNKSCKLLITPNGLYFRYQSYLQDESLFEISSGSKRGQLWKQILTEYDCLVGDIILKNPPNLYAAHINNLHCDGHAISRERYAELFNAIGVTYGEGNGKTTFNLPNIAPIILKDSLGESITVHAYINTGISVGGRLFDNSNDS